MTFNTIKHAVYGLYLTNRFGLRLKYTKDPVEKKRLRYTYAQAQLDALQITVSVENREKLPKEGQFLVVVNHRSIIDPPLVEVALGESHIFGPWIAKKELYNSFFFGLFVRNAGSILLDREKNQMSGFFADIKEAVKRGESIFIFPEGTRNKSEEKLTSFKEGARLIALKNRIPVLPVYIREHANEVLKNALANKSPAQEITVRIGDIIDYRTKGNLEEQYRACFQIV